MSNSLKVYIDDVRRALNSTLCHIHFPSPFTDGVEYPEIEDGRLSDAIVKPVSIVRNEREETLIEHSINSTRISFKIKQLDSVDKIVCEKYMRLLMAQADSIPILRRKAVDGYDITFLVTADHKRAESIDFIISFLTRIDSEISALKLEMNSRNRSIADSLLNQ